MFTCLHTLKQQLAHETKYKNENNELLKYTLQKLKNV